jgi:anti-sigma regulatory factor (Ser/Thr protein kinase)
VHGHRQAAPELGLSEQQQAQARLGIHLIVGEQAEILEDIGAESVPDLVIAVDESATNIIRHGYGGRPGRIEIELERRDDAIVITLRDDAPPFDPTGRPGIDRDTPLARRAPGGFGIGLTRASVDRVTHRVIDAGGPTGNELTLVKVLATAEETA